MKQNAELSSAGRRIFWSSQIVSIYLSAAILAGITLLLAFSWAKINHPFKGFWSKQAFRDRTSGELANLHEGGKTPTMGGLLILAR